MGWGGLPAILSGLIALILLSGAVSVARRESPPGRGARFRLLLLGGFAFLALFVLLLIARIISDAAAALAL